MSVFHGIVIKTDPENSRFKTILIDGQPVRGLKELYIHMEADCLTEVVLTLTTDDITIDLPEETLIIKGRE